MRDVEKWAQMDANNDNAGTGFQSFYARVEQIVLDCTTPVNEFSSKFQHWTDQLGKDFTEYFWTHSERSRELRPERRD